MHCLSITRVSNRRRVWGRNAHLVLAYMVRPEEIVGLGCYANCRRFRVPVFVVILAFEVKWIWIVLNPCGCSPFYY
jgi:hypothetical protein